MKSYTHLTEHERYHINAMNRQNDTLTEIARTITHRAQGTETSQPSAVRLNATQEATVIKTYLSPWRSVKADSISP